MTQMAWYTTRETVANALDIAPTTGSNTLIDRAVAAASEDVELLCHRRFAPELDTKSFEWPPRNGGNPSWLLRLDHEEVVSVSAVTADGTAMAGYLLEPDATGPPFTRLEMPRTGAGFTYGATPQRNVTVTGLFGYRDDRVTVGTVTQILSTATTHSAGTNLSFGATIGVGSVLCVGSERMDVTAKAFATTGYTITSTISDSTATTTVPVSSATGLIAGAFIQIDSEQMRIVSKSGLNLTVKRAVNGTVLASHTSGVAVWTNRALTLLRAQYGTTAATHAAASAATVWLAPKMVEALVVGDAINLVENDRAGWARDAGTGPTQREARGANIEGLRARVRLRYGRKHRMAAV